MRQRRPLPELFADLRRAPPRILPLEPDNHGLDRCRETIGLAKRPAAPIGERGQATVFVAVEDLIAGFAGDPELNAQRGHLLALEQAGDKPEPLVHDLTLLPRHALLL